MEFWKLFVSDEVTFLCTIVAVILNISLLIYTNVYFFSPPSYKFSAIYVDEPQTQITTFGTRKTKRKSWFY